VPCTHTISCINCTVKRERVQTYFVGDALAPRRGVKALFGKNLAAGKWLFPEILFIAPSGVRGRFIQCLARSKAA
jgi:hypothetical protein